MDTIIKIPLFVENHDELFNDLFANIPWNKVDYFKRHVFHYVMSNIADSSFLLRRELVVQHSYGRNERLNDLIIQVQREFGRKVVGVFLNLYLDGNEYAPYHADKYGCDTCLISLGETRILRYKKDKDNTDFVLNSGDLLFVPDEINNTYKHSLLKRVKIDKPRISVLLFFE